MLDELGRGTSPIDGLAVAYGALEHLTHVNRCRTLFATHYHRLGDLLGYNETDSKGKGEWKGVEFWCTDVEEDEVSLCPFLRPLLKLNFENVSSLFTELGAIHSRDSKRAQQ